MKRARAKPATARTWLALAGLAMLGMMVTPAFGQEKNPGGAVFTRVCESCHGTAASGGQGPPLVPFRKELPELVAIVRQGIGLMPVIPRSAISDEEIAQVHAWLKSLGEQ